MPVKSSIAALLPAGSALFWAGNFVVGRALGGEVPPVALTFWRWTLAFLILLPLTFGLLRRHRQVLLTNWKFLLALSVSGVAAFNLMLYQALTLTTALNALLFVATGPLTIAFGAWLVFRDTLAPGQILGILLSLFGAVVVLTRGDLATLATLQFNPGDLWVLAAVLAWTIYSLLLKRRPPDLPQIPMLTASAALGALLLLPLFLWRTALGETMAPTLPNLLALIYVALCASVLGFLFWNAGVAAIGPSRTGLYINLMPVFGAVLAVIFLGEQIAFYHLFSGLLVFAGIALASGNTWFARRDPKDVVPS